MFEVINNFRLYDRVYIVSALRLQYCSRTLHQPISSSNRSRARLLSALSPHTSSPTVMLYSWNLLGGRASVLRIHVNPRTWQLQALGCAVTTSTIRKSSVDQERLLKIETSSDVIHIYSSEIHTDCVGSYLFSTTSICPYVATGVKFQYTII